jgi:monoamine oxidase
VQRFALRTLHWTKTDESLVRLSDGALRTMADARRLYPRFDITRSWNFPTELLAAHPLAPFDQPLDAFLRRLGFDDDQLEYVRRSYANATGESIHRLSARAALDDWSDARFGTGDYRILDGYDTIHTRLGEGLDIRFRAVVTEIHWSRSDVRVITADGEEFWGENAIVTLPLAVLQSGNVRFEPALPPEKRAAIAALNMAPALKLIYRFAEPVLPRETAALYSAQNPPMWWTPTYGHASVDGQVWAAFATGDYARQLRALGEAGALEAGLRTLRAETARFDLQADAARWVDWASDPFALGGYSSEPPGAYGARAVLAQPTGEVLFWAGEATAAGDAAGTVHGAYLAGVRAAQEVLSLGIEQG